ncbi:hypothetical protein NQ315_008595 [Exocentrus adspersus]|uniref:Glucosidase II subunit alpha n=1 Tax=Exocentrus adspersus TaxID=1586481 RepID=A0AAV8W5R5_9CUCU|nr:hypothetical protein NQ315_008595 [Exocentrus adspersus]
MNNSSKYLLNFRDMRQQSLDDTARYSADIDNNSINDNVSVLEGGKARVKVLEKEHSRYELVDVLVDDLPPTLNIKANADGNVLSLTTENDDKFTVRVNGDAPFSVEFVYNNNVEVILKSDRLVLRKTDSDEAFSFDVEFAGAERLYGLHHHAHPLTLGETADGSKDPFRLRNSDTAGYGVDTTIALYGAVPVIYGHSPNWTSGMFLHNAAQQWVDIDYNGDNPSAYFMAESGTLDLFVMVGPTPKEIVRQFTNLTGIAHLPQLWTLGYHQCRYSYQSQEDVKDVVANMDNHDFPMDAIWLDIDYTNEKRYFTWNPETFSDPIEMQQNLSASNRKLVTIIDPHYKVDDDYPVYAGGKENLFVKLPSGENYEDDCWPGRSTWFDFLNPDARDYYASWFSYDKFEGTTETLAGIWNDMNEPAVFNGDYESSMPSECVHIGGVPHRDIHNIYGFLQTKATHQGLMQRDNGTKRPFILTRSHFAGSQRYAAMWTGDNNAQWSHLGITYPECINSNLVGLVFCGADMGGFLGNPPDALLQRWFQAGVWLPFFRSHSNSNTNRREPFLFAEEVQDVLRKAMKLRYKHIPVWYTLFYEHTLHGDPIIRPFFYEYPEVPEEPAHVLLGSNILARPVVEENVDSITVSFPGSNTNWYRVDDESWSVHKGNTKEELEVDINTSPYYYKAGSVIPLKVTERKSTKDMQDDPLTLYVNLDEDGNAEGTYYQDDYESFEYATDDKFLCVNLKYVPDTHGIQVEVIDGDSDEFSPVIKEIIIHDLEGSEVRYSTNAEGVPLSGIDVSSHFSKTGSNKMLILL